MDLGPWRNAPVSAEESTVESDGPLEANSSTRPFDTRAEHMRAYALWRRGDALSDICTSLGAKDNPLKKGTVMFVIFSLRILYR